MILSDMHTHSSFSADARDSIEKMCESAIQKNLYAVAITDHLECGMHKDHDISFGDFDKNIPDSHDEIEQAKIKYSDKIKILTGIEMGEPLHSPESAKHFLSLGYDFVLASVHNIRNEKDFFFMEYNQDMVEDLLMRYFNEIAEMAEYSDFDSLAHLNYPYRYILGKCHLTIPQNKFNSVIDRIFKLLIKRKKSLEINTSGLRQELKETLPSRNFIERYKELGGEYITIGSDAHNTDDLSKGIPEAIKMIKEIGFKGYYIYEKRQPKFIKI